MKKILLALQFLTVIPLGMKNSEEKDFSGSLVYFPVIGLFIALILAVGLRIFQSLGFPDLTLSLFLVVLLVIITGGIHLDGLADTTDGLYSRKEKDETLAIMRDPHIGTMGVLAVVCVLLLKVALFYSLVDPLKIRGLFLMCLLSRWSMVMLIYLFPYARKEGKAKAFIEGVNLNIFLLATGITGLSASLIWKIKGLILWVIIAACTFIIGKLTAKKFGGITGDVLGATNEIIEVICLFLIYLLGGIKLWLM